MNPWRVVLALALIAAVPAVAGGSPGEPTTTLSVRYRSAEHAYLNQGRNDGVVIGEQFVVVRKGAEIARLEVVFVSSRSATCAIIGEIKVIAADDVVVRPPEVAAMVSPAARVLGRTSASPIVVLSPNLVAPPVASSRQRSPSRRSRARSSGSISVGWDGFRAPAVDGRDYNEVTGRFDVRLRNIGRHPYDVRIRTRLRRTARVDPTSGAVSVPETRNRMYEISLRHAPVDGRFSFVVGRVGVSQFVSMGYIDGGLVQFRLSRSLAIGAFAGTAPTVDGIQFGLDSPRYGGFLHLSSVGTSTSHRFDFVVAGIAESYAEGDRKYATVEASYSAPRWTLLQRAEIESNLPTRENADGGSGLSALSLITTYRVSPFSRIHVSYNSRRDHRPGAIRLDSDLFEDRFRTSLRAGVSVGSARGISVNANGAVRYQHGTSDRTYSGGLGLRFRAAGLAVQTNLTAYSGPTVNGLVLNARLSSRITREIRLSGTYSGFTSKRADGSMSRTDHRVGGFVWVDLRSGLFFNGGVEVGFGPNLEGTRAVAEAGFRF